MRHHHVIRRLGALAAGLAVWALTGQTPAGQAPAAPKAPTHATAVKRLLIRNAMVIYGNAKPAYGPLDILVEDGLIAKIGRVDPAGIEAVIDATGKYVMPGIINTHAHLQDERAGIPQPFQYEMNLYLASGVTTFRDVGSDFEKAVKWREQSAKHEIPAPRLLLYSGIWRAKGTTPTLLREGVRYAKERGSDGLKLGGLDRDQLEAVLDEAHKIGLKTATHIGVEETTATDYAELGVTSIEHFYGVGDASLDGIQNFPPDMNYNNEIHRFGRAGELYIQDNFSQARLNGVLDLMVKHGVSWSPTMSIYIAGRDLIRSQNLPWYKEYLHPSMEEYWKPDLQHHGSFFIGWTATQEVRWKHDYEVWMAALKQFALKGGNITTGDDAGFIYSLYGFGLSHELELQQEAGFHPLEVLRHATWNGAKLVGMEDRLGKVRQGYMADLLVVNGNPLANLRILNAYGADVNVGDKNVHAGGIEWTIKDGIPYHVPTLMKETREMVAKARAAKPSRTTTPDGK